MLTVSKDEFWLAQISDTVVFGALQSLFIVMHEITLLLLNSIQVTIKSIQWHNKNRNGSHWLKIQCYDRAWRGEQFYLKMLPNNYSLKACATEVLRINFEWQGAPTIVQRWDTKLFLLNEFGRYRMFTKRNSKVQ